MRSCSVSDTTKMRQPPAAAPWVGVGGFRGILFRHRNGMKHGAPRERASTPKLLHRTARGGFTGRTSQCFEVPSFPSWPAGVLGAALASVGGEKQRPPGPVRAARGALKDVDVGVGFPFRGPRRATLTPYPPPARGQCQTPTRRNLPTPGRVECVIVLQHAVTMTTKPARQGTRRS